MYFVQLSSFRFLCRHSSTFASSSFLACAHYVWASQCLCGMSLNALCLVQLVPALFENCDRLTSVMYCHWKSPRRTFFFWTVHTRCPLQLLSATFHCTTVTLFPHTIFHCSYFVCASVCVRVEAWLRAFVGFAFYAARLFKDSQLWWGRLL